jgi:hypothetical protein
MSILKILGYGYGNIYNILNKNKLAVHKKIKNK